MKKLSLFTTAAFLLVACNTTTPDPMVNDDSDHSEMMSSSGAAASLDRLNNSPRHQEWVTVQNGEKTIHTWVVYPETSEPTPVVILIHENRGLNDWARSMADQVAEAGYIAVAPDLLSGYSITETRTSDFADDDARTAAISSLNSADVMADLQAVSDWAITIEASNGQLASAGFCWGGARSFELAGLRQDLDATMVFYGTSPTDPAAYANINHPVYGFYGGADERVNATIPTAETTMQASDKPFEYEIYEGAGHAFMRSGEDPAGDPANVAARDAAWERMKSILEGI